MKKEFSTIPEQLSEAWPGEFRFYSWQYFLTAIPSPLFVVTSYKANGRENACLQSWSTFVGDRGEFLCILGSVDKDGHLYQTLQETKCCVLNFPSRDIYDLCLRTVENNGLGNDEITDSGLTSEDAVTIYAPRIQECFLNIECEYVWERELFHGSRHVVVTLRGKHVAMDPSRMDESLHGRYGKDGFLLYASPARDAETGKVFSESVGSFVKKIE